MSGGLAHLCELDLAAALGTAAGFAETLSILETARPAQGAAVRRFLERACTTLDPAQAEIAGEIVRLTLGWQELKL